MREMLSQNIKAKQLNRNQTLYACRNTNYDINETTPPY